MARYVLRGMHAYLVGTYKNARPEAGTREMAEAIFEMTHKYKLIMNKHKNELVKKIEKTISWLLGNEEDLRQQVSKIKGGDYNTSTMQSFASVCNKLAKKYETMVTIDEY